MAYQAIVDKLRDAFAHDIRSEEQVVYILVEIRKLIDLTDTSDKYRTLAFYCSWALHVEMSFKEAQKILKYFDQAHPELVGGKELHQLKKDLERNLDRIAKLTQFRDDLDTFCQEHNLPSEGLMAQWPFFLHYYARVIEDCPLIVKAPKGTTSNIDKVVVTHELGHTVISGYEEDHQPFRVTWICYDKQGKSGGIEIYNTYPVPKASAAS